MPSKDLIQEKKNEKVLLALIFFFFLFIFNVAVVTRKF